jgi:hypothetical protein
LAKLIYERETTQSDDRFTLNFPRYERHKEDIMENSKIYGENKFHEAMDIIN